VKKLISSPLERKPRFICGACVADSEMSLRAAPGGRQLLKRLIASLLRKLHLSASSSRMAGEELR
jgi:hypothetical protein